MLTATELATVARERDEIYRRLPSQVQQLWQRAFGCAINIIQDPHHAPQTNAVCIRHAMEAMLDTLQYAEWQDPA